MTTQPKLNQEELVAAFNQFMPKRPVYPPLVVDEDDPLDNSDTDSDMSDSEEELSPEKRHHLAFFIIMEQTKKCRLSYEESKMKSVEQYITDNIYHPLVKALRKMINLKVPPKDPLVWLAYRLMNDSSNDKTVSKFQDHLVKPKGVQLHFRPVRIDVRERRALPVTSANSGEGTSLGGKRKLSEDNE